MPLDGARGMSDPSPLYRNWKRFLVSCSGEIGRLGPSGTRVSVQCRIGRPYGVLPHPQAKARRSCHCRGLTHSSQEKHVYSKRNDITAKPSTTWRPCFVPRAKNIIKSPQDYISNDYTRRLEDMSIVDHSKRQKFRYLRFAIEILGMVTTIGAYSSTGCI